jgi:hypothetical protein
MQLKLHAAKSGTHVSMCLVGGGMQQAVLTVLDNLEDIIVWVCGRGVARGDGGNERLNAKQVAVVGVVMVE